MKRLVLALLFTLPFHILLAQNAKVIPASTNPAARKEAVIEYTPSATAVKSESESSDSKIKKVKCVPGCSGKKQCVKKASSAKSSPAYTEDKSSETSKK